MRAAAAQQPGRQRRLAAAADRQRAAASPARWRSLAERARRHRASAAAPASATGPAPRASTPTRGAAQRGGQRVAPDARCRRGRRSGSRPAVGDQRVVVARSDQSVPGWRLLLDTRDSTLAPSVPRPARGSVPVALMPPMCRTPPARRSLDQLFRTARTHNQFSGRVSDETLRELYDLVKMGPTTANSGPARFVFVKSAEAKAKLGPALDEGNYAKTMAAPVTVIVGLRHGVLREDAVPVPAHRRQVLVRQQARGGAGNHRAAQRQPAGRLPDPGRARAGSGLPVRCRASTTPRSMPRSSPAPRSSPISWSTWASATPPSCSPRSPRLPFDEAARIV